MDGAFVLSSIHSSILLSIQCTILVTSLNVTYNDNVINKAKPNICILSSNSWFIGFLLIPSIINNSILPPSNGGKIKRFVTPNDNEINAII